MASLHTVPLNSSPRPGTGIFETILIWEDRPIELDAHLARLSSSARRLFGADPPGCRDLVLNHSHGGGVGRLRLELQPTASGRLKTSVIVAPFDRRNVFPEPPLRTKLESIVVDRGYGEHKWIDRDMLTRAEAAVGPGAAPLLVGADGVVFEASRSNIFAVRDGLLITPPLDGAILPGIARTGVLALAAELGICCREERLDLGVMLSAEEIFLTNSLRGVEPVGSLDGTQIKGEGPVSRELKAALKKRWLEDP